MATSQKAVIALCRVAAALALLPAVLYGLALWQVEGRPTPQASAGSASTNSWQACRESLPMRVDPLNPWEVLGSLFFGDPQQAAPGSRAAWAIARNYNAAHLKSRAWWHPSGAALTIWITRNWSADQIASTVAANNYCGAAPNNSFKPNPLRGSA